MSVLTPSLSPTPLPRANSPRTTAIPTSHHVWQLYTIILSVNELRLHFAYIPSIDNLKPLLATLCFINPAGFKRLSCHASASSVDERYCCSTKILNTPIRRHIINVEYTYTHYTAKKPAATPLILPEILLPEAALPIDVQYTTTLEYSYN